MTVWEHNLFQMVQIRQLWYRSVNFGTDPSTLECSVSRNRRLSHRFLSSSPTTSFQKTEHTMRHDENGACDEENGKSDEEKGASDEENGASGELTRTKNTTRHAVFQTRMKHAEMASGRGGWGAVERMWHIQDIQGQILALTRFWPCLSIKSR